MRNFSLKGYRKVIYRGYLSLFLGLYAFPSAAQALKLPALKEIGSQRWVQKKVETYPELEWLLDKEVQHTQEGKAEQFKNSWSQKLRGRYYPEFERTMLSIVTLYLIVEGSKQAYERFTFLQPDSEKLSWQSFKHLHDFALGVLKADPQRLKALEVNLLLGDMGKTKTARIKAEQYGITELDHDHFLDMCLHKCPQLFPTFLLLEKAMQQVILNSTGLVHIGHVIHVEGGPEILTKLKNSEILVDDVTDFDFEFLTHICDLSAARGHEDNRGSKVLTENTYQVLMATRKAFHYLARHSEQEALQYYLKIRMRWLGLNPSKLESLILARLGAMMRLSSPQDGKVMKEAYDHLTKQQQEMIMVELNPLTYRKEETSTYIPALFINLLSAYKQKGKTEALRECVLKGVPLVAGILHRYRANEMSQVYTPTLTLNFNTLAGQLRDHPELLGQASVFIDSEGNVRLGE